MRDHSTGSASPCPDGRYTKVPNVLHALVASPREYQLVALLLSYRWFPSSPIIPSTKTLGETMGCSQRTIRRTVAALEHRGYIRREERRAQDNRQMSNQYILTGALLAAVTACDAADVQGERQPWQGRRTRVASERYSGKQYEAKQKQSMGRYTMPPRSGSLLVSRYGPVEPRR